MTYAAFKNAVIKKKLKPGINTKAGLSDHILPVRFQFTYIAKQQILNSGFWWSILSGHRWSSPLVFPHRARN